MSHPTNKPSSRLWAVAVDRESTATTRDRGRHVCHCLQDMGSRVILVEDGDEAGLEADVLLFMENLADFGKYRFKMSRPRGKRPITAVWMLETLPPSSLPATAERSGKTAAAWHYRLGLRLPKSRLSRLERLVSLRSPRQWLYIRLSGIGFRTAFRDMAINEPGLKDNHWKQARAALQNWDCLQRTREEGWLDHIIVSTRQRQQFLEGRGWTAPFVPVGAHPDHGRLLDIDRDLDVVFIGYLRNDRRRRLLAQLKTDLDARGIHLEIVTGNCFGEERTRLLNRTKLVVMFHQYTWSPAWIRFIYASVCGACVISEPMADDQPFREGIHYAASSASAMPETIEGLLKNDSERTRLAQAARELCQSSLTLQRSVEEITEIVNRTRAS